jgi:hypothetical protein
VIGPEQHVPEARDEAREQDERHFVPAASAVRYSAASST